MSACGQVGVVEEQERKKQLYSRLRVEGKVLTGRKGGRNGQKVFLVPCCEGKIGMSH